MEEKDRYSLRSISPHLSTSKGPLIASVSTDESPMELDECLEVIGWGKYQIKIIIALGFSVATFPVDLWMGRKVMEKLICEHSEGSDDLHSQVVLGWFFMLIMGTFTSGVACDLFGRRPVLIASGYSTILLNIILSVYPDVVVSTIIRYLTGFLTAALIPPISSYLLEMTATHGRSFAILILGFVIGLCSGIVAIINSNLLHYEHWDIISPVIDALPKFLAVCFLHLIDESVRFLVVKDNITKAKKTITSMSLTNKNQYITLSVSSESPASNISILYLFKRTYIKQTIALSIVSFALSWMTHAFGSSLSVDPGSSTCKTLCERPLNAQDILTLGKTFLIILPLISITIILTYKMNANRLVVLGVLFISMLVISIMEYLVRNVHGVEVWWILITCHAFSLYFATIVLYLFTGEVFPTVLRGRGYGVVAVLALLAHTIQYTVFKDYCVSRLSSCLNHVIASVIGTLALGTIWSFQNPTHDSHLLDKIGDRTNESVSINGLVSQYGASNNLTSE